MITNLTFYILAAIAVLIIGISKSGFGTGLAVLGVPLMALAVPPAQAAAILLPLLIALDLFNLLHYRSKFDRTNLWILLPGSMVGILIGALTFRYLSDAHIRIMIGGIAVIFVMNYFFNKHREKPKTSLTGSREPFGVRWQGSPVSEFMPGYYQPVFTYFLIGWIKQYMWARRRFSLPSSITSN